MDYWIQLIFFDDAGRRENDTRDTSLLDLNGRRDQLHLITYFEGKYSSSFSIHDINTCLLFQDEDYPDDLSATSGAIHLIRIYIVGWLPVKIQ